jgi:hypothetical protein
MWNRFHVRWWCSIAGALLLGEGCCDKQSHAEQRNIVAFQTRRLVQELEITQRLVGAKSIEEMLDRALPVYEKWEDEDRRRDPEGYRRKMTTFDGGHDPARQADFPEDALLAPGSR